MKRNRKSLRSFIAEHRSDIDAQINAGPISKRLKPSSAPPSPKPHSPNPMITTTTQPARIAALQRRRTAHHAALGSLINGNAAAGLKLWRKLRRLEQSLYAVCLAYTNGEVDLPAWQAAKDHAKAGLPALFGGSLPAGLFINGDPRGHMLKLDCDVRPIPPGMERDWGGNGILAPIID